MRISFLIYAASKAQGISEKPLLSSNFHVTCLPSQEIQIPKGPERNAIDSDLMQSDKALEFYDKAIQVQSNHAEAQCNKGVILKNQGKLNEAIGAYQCALEAAPDFQIVHTNLAIALTEKGTLVKNEGKLEEG